MHHLDETTKLIWNY